MRLDVGERYANCTSQTPQRADLIDALLEDLRLGACQFTTTEMLAVGKSRMRADLHAMLCRQAQRGVSRRWVAGMEAAGDVGRRDERHQLGIVRAAFTEITIEIDLHKPNRLLVLQAILTPKRGKKPEGTRQKQTPISFQEIRCKLSATQYNRTELKSLLRNDTPFFP